MDTRKARPLELSGFHVESQIPSPHGRLDCGFADRRCSRAQSGARGSVKTAHLRGLMFGPFRKPKSCSNCSTTSRSGIRLSPSSSLQERHETVAAFVPASEEATAAEAATTQNSSHRSSNSTPSRTSRNPRNRNSRSRNSSIQKIPIHAVLLEPRRRRASRGRTSGESRGGCAETWS
jgi:hypothetical protein